MKDHAGLAAAAAPPSRGMPLGKVAGVQRMGQRCTSGDSVRSWSSRVAYAPDEAAAGCAWCEGCVSGEQHGRVAFGGSSPT